MTTRTKAVLVIGGGVAAFLVIRALRGRNVKGFFSELNMVNCKCMSTEFFRDGTSKSTEVPIERCAADVDLKFAVDQCAAKSSAGNGGLDE